MYKIKILLKKIYNYMVRQKKLYCNFLSYILCNIVYNINHFPALVIKKIILKLIKKKLKDFISS